MKRDVIMLLCYIAGSLCFLWGSIISLWKLLRP